MNRWFVKTDRGDIVFHIHDVRRDIKLIDKRVLIRDYLDNRYEIPDYTKLDKKSLKIFTQFS